MSRAEIALQFPGSTLQRLQTKNFNPAGEAAFRRANLTSLREYFGGVQDGDYPMLANTLPNALPPTVTLTGTRTNVDLHYAPARTPRRAQKIAGPRTAQGRPVQSRLRDEQNKIRTAIELAINWIDGSPTLRFPNDRLDVFIAEENQYSLGYLWQGPGDQIGAAILLGETAGSWSGNYTTKTVAQECFEHYKPAWTVNALERRIAATFIHEMGHIFHQILSLPHYILLARVSELADKENPTQEAKYGDFSGAPSRDALNNFRQATTNFGRGVSTYASFAGLNEFVAEVFCALVMGSPIGSDQHNEAAQFYQTNVTRAQIINAYTACGGPMPEQGVRHTRKA